MPISHRFGKRISLPSTRKIRHELILMWAEAEISKAKSSCRLEERVGIGRCCVFQIQAAAMMQPDAQCGSGGMTALSKHLFLLRRLRSASFGRKRSVRANSWLPLILTGATFMTQRRNRINAEDLAPIF
jgi:hypothetical protein